MVRLSKAGPGGTLTLLAVMSYNEIVALRLMLFTAAVLTQKPILSNVAEYGGVAPEGKEKLKPSSTTSVPVFTIFEFGGFPIKSYNLLAWACDCRPATRTTLPIVALNAFFMRCPNFPNPSDYSACLSSVEAQRTGVSVSNTTPYGSGQEVDGWR
jgi:hypothetical protein